MDFTTGNFLWKTNLNELAEELWVGRFELPTAVLMVIEGLLDVTPC